VEMRDSVGARGKRKERPWGFMASADIEQKTPHPEILAKLKLGRPGRKKLAGYVEKDFGKGSKGERRFTEFAFLAKSVILGTRFCKNSIGRV